MNKAKMVKYNERKREIHEAHKSRHYHSVWMLGTPPPREYVDAVHVAFSRALESSTLNVGSLKDRAEAMQGVMDSMARRIEEAAREGLKPNPRFMETGPRRTRP